MLYIIVLLPHIFLEELSQRSASPPLSFADQHSQKDSQTEQSPWSSYSSQLWQGAISCRRLKPQLKRSYWTGVRVSLTKTSDLFEWIWNKTFNPCPEKTPIFWRCFSVNVFCCYDLIFYEKTSWVNLFFCFWRQLLYTDFCTQRAILSTTVCVNMFSL